jgi:PTH1 family peptidyl-tRNA hydrolase
METFYLIVGLGNPGAEYGRTRHNAGFLAVERLAQRWQAGWALDEGFRSRLARVERQGRKLMLCQPQTYMNSSGEAVVRLQGYYRLPLTHLVVVVDDADLPLGELRLRPQGSSGGHHGLESVERHLGSRAYPRLRIGIGRTAAGAREITGHVLSRFSRDEAELLEKVLDRAADQVECWLEAGIGKAMSQFNGVINHSAKESQ